MTSRRSFWQVLVSLASLGLYALLAFRYPLGRSLGDPRASWASMVEPSVLNAAPHIAIYLGLTLLSVQRIDGEESTEHKNSEGGAYNQTEGVTTQATCSKVAGMKGAPDKAS